MKEEIIKLLYLKHGKMMLGLKIASVEWGSSYSQASKQLSKYSQDYIL